MAYSTNRDSTSTIEEQLRQTQIDGPSCKLVVKVKKAKEVGVDEKWGVYPMNSTPRGLAVIFNYDNIPNYNKRKGSQIDVENLEELCKQLGFTVETYEDLKRQETLDTLDLVGKNPVMQTADMLMVFMMSHGDKNYILCSDDEELETEQILRKFTCIELKGKPKFIAFQACRGHEVDVGVTRIAQTDAKQVQPAGNQTKDPMWQDMIIAYSTVPGFVSYRDITYGSWFIESLVKVFMNSACDRDLLLLLRDISNEMDNIPHKKGFKQSFVHEIRSLKRALFFNPGLPNTKLEVGSSEDTQTPGLTNTYNNPKKDTPTPSLTNTDYSLERGNYKLQKIETGSVVYCLQYDDDMIVAGLRNGSIKSYNKQTQKLANSIKAHSKPVNCLQFEKNILFSGSDDGTVRIWQNYTYKVLKNTLELDSEVLCLKCNFNDKLVTGTLGQLSVWRINSPTDITLTNVLHTYTGKEYRCVDFDNTYIVNGSNYKIQVWSTKSLKLLKTMTGHTDWVRTLQLEKYLVVSGSDDKTIRVWNIETGQCIRKLKGHNYWVYCVRFDARRIVSASLDKTIKIWDLEAALDTTIAKDAVCIRTLKKHTDYVNCLQFDDTEIISGSSDNTIRIWNFQTTQ